MKILITGGAGFIGQRLARHLLAENREVRLVLADWVATEAFAGDPRVQAVKCDIADRSELARLVTPDITAVYHLAAIVSGQAGGTPGMIRANLVSDFRGVAFKPIDFRTEGLKRAVSIPEILSFEIEGVASRNRSGEPFYIDNTAHPANRRLALARSKELHVRGFGLALDMVGKDNNGHFAPFAWTG